MLYEERFKKKGGETFHQRGQKVWLLKDWTVTVRPQRGKSLGEVAKDSIFPDLWVNVNCWNKDQFVDYCNRNNPPWVKEAAKKKALNYMNRKRLARGPRT